LTWRYTQNRQAKKKYDLRFIPCRVERYLKYDDEHDVFS
jgi:hypothetical protein